ncbi:MAG: hypothetical protein KGP28_12070 [Bdellovibrionales bacterium]|nr:hypothetical protein [Bdellovibrionales bacterium]
MRIIIGYLILGLLLGCGQNRDMGGGALQSLPPQKLGEVRGQTSLGPTVLSLYSGEVDLARVLGQVGVLDERIEVTEIKSAPGAPFEQRSEEHLTRNSPVFLLSSSAEKTELAAFVDHEFQEHLATPLIHSKIVEIFPLIRYCERFAFLGNSYLKDPVKCTPGTWCFEPQPTSFQCRLDGQGQTECQTWRRYGFPNQGPLPFSRADFAITEAEPRAFVCSQWANGSPFSYRLREMRKLVRLRASFDRGIKIKIETPSGQLDSGTPDVRWVQFKEESVDFSWDK